MGAFHAGEAAVQQRLEVRDRMAEVAERAIRDHMPEQHRSFFSLLPFLVVGQVDDAGQPWASVVAGPPGFVSSPDERRLQVNAAPLAGAPLRWRAGESLGLLGLQPHTRRRNRMNGWVDTVTPDGWSMTVGQSFGNCPKYIVPREARYAPGRQAHPPRRAETLDARDLTLVRGADTLFIATAHPRAPHSAVPEEGVDVSHRGGAPGFVSVDDEGALWIPDYAGNLFFNTFGNLALNPRAGLLFIDFPRGDLLHVAGQAEVVWEPRLAARFPGALRLVRVEVHATVRMDGALPLDWGEPPAAT
jgi:predicted pyridoxine 5'-phosphate oxidase superfamily flavin-nucleotide-binding protein